MTPRALLAPPIRAVRLGAPHPRLLWLDISVAAAPVLVWQEGSVKDPARVKDKARLPLTEIEDIRSGLASDVFQRSGRISDEQRYMTFKAANGRTLDIELPSAASRDWMFARFGQLFNAYAMTLLRDGRSAGDVTRIVRGLMAQCEDDVAPATTVARR